MSNICIGGDSLNETILVKNVIIKSRCEGIVVSMNKSCRIVSNIIQENYLGI